MHRLGRLAAVLALVFVGGGTIGASDPTFASPQSIPVAGAFAIASGDLNGDGKADLVVATPATSELALLFNTTPPGPGVISLAPKVTVSLPGQVTHLKVVDIDRDGRPDIVAYCAFQSRLIVLQNRIPLGSTTPTFNGVTRDGDLAGTGQGMEVADLNGDGRMDVVLTGQSGMVILQNTEASGGGASPSFNRLVVFGSSVTAVKVADLNADGQLDLLFLSPSTGQIFFGFANGPFSYTFASQTLGTTSLSDLAAGDLNGDGKPDIAVGASGAAPVIFLQNKMSPGSLSPNFNLTSTSLGGPPNSLLLQDLNGDGRADLINASASNSIVTVLVNRSAGGQVPTFQLVSAVPTAGSRQAIGVDLNGDGAPDLVSVDANPPSLSIAVGATQMPVGVNYGAAIAVAGTPLSPGLDAGDLNGDGFPDLVFAGNSGHPAVQMNATIPGSTGPSFLPRQQLVDPIGAGLTQAAFRLANLSGDGKPDLVALLGPSSHVVVYTNQTSPGSGTFASTPWANPVLSDATALEVADLNGDGRLDLLVVGSLLQVWLNTSSPGGPFTASLAGQFGLSGTPNPRPGIAVGDFNLDGKPDVAISGHPLGSVTLFLNTSPSGGFSLFSQPALQYLVSGMPFRMAVGDINGDGRPDLVALNAGNATILMNRGLLATGFPDLVRSDVPTPPGALGLVVKDLSGDGRPDIAVNSYGGGVTVLTSQTALGSMTASFGLPSTSGTPTFVDDLVAADLNLDGRPDLLAGPYPGATSLYALMNTPPAPNLPIIVLHPPTSVEAVSGNATRVQLDAGGTINPGGGTTIFNWFVNGFQWDSRTSSIEVYLPFGLNHLRLRVDGAGGSTTYDFDITVVDTKPPVFVAVPGPFTLEQASLAGTPFVVPPAEVTDNTILTLRNDSTGSFPLGTTTVTYFAKDQAGNQTSASTTVTVVDTTPPRFIDASAQVLWLFEEGGGPYAFDSSGYNRVGSFSGFVSWIPTPVGKALKLEPTSHASIPAFTLDSNWTLQAWTLFPLPSTPAGFRTLAENSPGHQHVVVDSGGQLGVLRNGFFGSGGHVNGLNGWHLISAVGSHGQTRFYVDDLFVGVSQAQEILPVQTLGNSAGNSQNWSAIDALRLLNSARQDPEISFDFSKGARMTTVSDNLVTSILPPITLSTSNLAGLTSLKLPAIVDVCDSQPYQIPPSEPIPVGRNLVFYSALDHAGNGNHAQQEVTVELTNVAPVIVVAPLPPQILTGMPVTFDASGSSDPSGGQLKFDWYWNGDHVWTGPILTWTFPVGANSIFLQVSNSMGIVSEQEFVFEVLDKTKPVLAGVFPSLTIDLLPGESNAIPLLWPTATDDQDGAVPVTATASPAIFPDGSASGDYVTFPDGLPTTITFSAADASGNVIQATRTVTINRTNLLSEAFRPHVEAVSGNIPSLPGADSYGDSTLLGRPVFSRNGRFLVFQSSNPAIVPGESSERPQVYLRDLLLGTTRLISRNFDQTKGGNTGADLAAISDDGRLVAFLSHSNDLMTDPPKRITLSNRYNVFVRSVLLEQTAQLYSGRDVPRTPGSLSISGDGRTVAFVRDPEHFEIPGHGLPWPNPGPLGISVVNPFNGLQTPLPVAMDGGGPNGRFSQVAMSPDGIGIFFTSSATNLVPNVNQGTHVYYTDLGIGTATLIDTDQSGFPTAGDSKQFALGADGRVVAFQCSAPDLAPVPGAPGDNLYVKDLSSGIMQLVNVDATGAALLLGSNPVTALSADGRFVAFGDAVDNGNVYLRNLEAGTTALVSRSMTGIGGGNGESHCPTISADGRKVAFQSFADDLVPGDTPGLIAAADVFVADMRLGGITCASRTPAGVPAGKGVWLTEAPLSPGGEVVAFMSSAPGLTSPGVPDGTQMVYAFHMEPSGGVGLPTAAIDAVGPFEAGSPVHLDGSASSDPSGLPLHFEWTWHGNVIGSAPAIDYALPQGDQAVTLTVTSSSSGLTASVTILFHVEDTTAPVISGVADVTIELTSPGGAPYAFAPLALDNSGVAPTLTSNALSLYPLGATPVTFVAEDESHNVSSVTVSVRVIDSTAPVFTFLPIPPVLEQTQRDGTPYVLEMARAEDASTLGQAVTSDAPATFPLGETAVTFTAMDASSNTTSTRIVVTIQDTRPPVFTFIPGDITVEMTDPAGTPVTVPLPTASDICDAIPVITSDAPPLFLVGTRVVHFTALDKSGNSAPASMKVTVVDSTPPNTTLLSGPATPTTSTSATFSFASTEPGPYFLRSLDNGPAVPVQSPETLSNLSSGQHVYQVWGVDAALNPDPTPAVFTWVVDTTAPVQGSVRDGGTVDVSYQASTTTISAAWFDFNDPETGISAYDWAIGTTPFGTNVQPFIGVGGATTGTASGLTLLSGNTYYVTVRGTNGVGLTCAPVSSNGVVIETSAPTQGSVNDGLGADLNFQTSLTAISANWSGFADPQSGIAGYEWAIGTTSGATDVQAYTAVGPGTSATRAGLSLALGQKYFVTIRATNGLLLQSTATSNGVIVDNTAPVAGSVRDGVDKDVDFQSSLTMIVANWTTFNDPQSSPVTYEWAIGTGAGLINVQPFVSLGTSKTASNASLSLSDKQKYFVTLRATNGAGLATMLSSNGVTVDATPASAGTVSIGFTGNKQINANWTAFSDTESGVATLEWAIGSAAGLTDVLGFTGVKTTDSSAKKNGLTLTSGKKYYVTMRATNGTGAVTTASSAAGTAP